MSNELIEKLREDGKFLGGNFGKLMHEAADALEARAAPVGEREAFEAEIAALIKDRADIARKADGEYRNFYLQCAWQGFQAGAAYQRAQQPQSAEAVETIDLDAAAWQSIKDAASKSPWVPEQYFLNDWVADVCAFLEDSPQPSAGVVMPEYDEGRTTHRADEVYQDGWNACLDEFARLNGKEVGRG